MNKNLYRLVFDKKRGMTVAVAETVVSCKKNQPGEGGAMLARQAQVWLCRVKWVALGASLAAGTAWPLGAMSAGSLPSGANVVAGQVTVTQPSAQQLQIVQQSGRAVVQWNSFDIGAGNAVQFIQPGSTSQILNRVVSGSTTQILGSLTANGQVFIVNPYGVMFGHGAVINVGSILASTKDINTDAFMAGCATLSLLRSSNTTGLVQNDGTINAPGGYVVLLGDQVRNTGTIQANGGKVVLLAGDRATVVLNNGLLAGVTLDAASADALVENAGQIDAQGGQVLLSAKSANALLNNVINLSGVINASNGGQVTLDGGAQGVVNLTGATIDVSSQTGQGGNVTVMGQYVGLFNGSEINANGATGGGTVLVGGSFHGTDANVTNANMTILDASSRIDASATQIGRGGNVAVWSDASTDFEGTITARGGAQGVMEDLWRPRATITFKHLGP
ncbi:filamentous hemagglutinin N-terminal domain-containing protein [Cupriavidus sp. D39]|uniref:two-partner secretion domain-containing protein n=1 Tax=Cupriavidus sp. D39 TaxID=2997877 RepID=UPI00226DB273|nr:filamentous hemagglutinin N-terminal domain-containing protein [Cupriavidus sp. D39]MCY0858762.1 filamentous hemagglutinin N-terminal domain-containing protein [Cupriavidus sp. D39]